MDDGPVGSLAGSLAGVMKETCALAVGEIPQHPSIRVAMVNFFGFVIRYWNYSHIKRYFALTPHGLLFFEFFVFFCRGQPPKSQSAGI